MLRPNDRGIYSLVISKKLSKKKVLVIYMYFYVVGKVIRVNSVGNQHYHRPSAFR